MVEEKTQLCSVCAWRADCKKKFYISKKPGLRCVDFTRDITLKSPGENQREPDGDKGTEDHER